MHLFEDPVQFAVLKKNNTIEVKYTNLTEISQGGPVVGTISMNEKKLEGLFGGPCLLTDSAIYVPFLVRKFLGSGFKLARINPVTLGITYLTETRDLFFLEKIEGGFIYFFEDIGKRVKGCCPV